MTITLNPLALPEGLDVGHWTAWLEDLYTTDAPQAQAKLAALVTVTDGGDGDGKVLGFCCLGRGCVVAGIPIDTFDDATGGVVYEFDGSQAMAPDRFLEWLGLLSTDHTDRHPGDIKVDWPEDLRTPPDTQTTESFTYRDALASATALNDLAHLTFPQIADVFRYFGPKR